MRFGPAVAFVVLLAVAPAAAADCRLQLVASLPMVLQEQQIVVDAAIAAHPLKLIVDTAGTTLLKESVAKSVGLKSEMRQSWQHASLFGGVRIHRYAVASDFRLGTLLRGGVTVLLLPESAHPDWQADGLLGSNVLRDYDVDFDFGHGKLNLFLPHRCPGRAAYWVADEAIVAKVRIETKGDNVRIPVQIDGRQIEAILDTGAAVTVMDQEAYMPLFGLTPQTPGVEEYHVSGDSHPRYAYSFKTMTFGGVLVNKARVRFISRHYSKKRDPDMLLGTNILRLLHVFIAYREGTLYITAADAH